MAGLFLESDYIRHGHVRADVGIAGYEARFIGFDFSDHSRFLFDGLGAVNKRHTAGFCQGNGQFFTRNGLHDSGNHGNRHFNSGLFPFFIFYERRFERYIRRHTLTR